MSLKKHKLTVAVEDNYCLLGISSDEPDYRVCWLINGKLGCNMQQTDPLILYNKKLNSDQEFSVFHYDDEPGMISFRLIENRTDKGYFLNELKNIDFIFHIQGECPTNYINEILSIINTIPEIRMCVPINLSKIKDKQRLELW